MKEFENLKLRNLRIKGIIDGVKGRGVGIIRIGNMFEW
jgi:hypothetical protein